MIFVTVGTHEQPFNRLVEYMDNLVKKDVLNEEVIIQTGFSTYEPKYCTWKKLYPYNEMIELVDKARIVITHGGPSSFIMPLQIGKTPIVVPRKKKYKEHVNDHQVEFSKKVATRMKNIIIVENINDLEHVISDYNKIITHLGHNIVNNNAAFNKQLEKIVENM